MNAPATLEVEGLSVTIPLAAGPLRAVRNVDLRVDRGETLCIVGESGCGKSMTALALMDLLPPRAQRSATSIRFKGEDLAAASETHMEALRGNRMARIFQDPMTALNPAYTIGNQLVEGCLRHRRAATRAEASARAVALLEICGIGQARRRLRQYPHQLSGGLRQRVMIAMALMTGPDLIIADEPTTALDVTIQAQILDLIRKVQDETGAALMLITHDLGVVAETVHDIVVMYAGRVVERGTVDEVLLAPKHPYTEGLLESTPSKGKRGQRLNVIKGTVANPFNLSPGCNFTPRCPYAFEPCPVHDPRIEEASPPDVACWLYTRAPGQPPPQRQRPILPPLEANR